MPSRLHFQNGSAAYCLIAIYHHNDYVFSRQCSSISSFRFGHFSIDKICPCLSVRPSVCLPVFRLSFIHRDPPISLLPPLNSRWLTSVRPFVRPSVCPFVRVRPSSRLILNASLHNTAYLYICSLAKRKIGERGDSGIWLNRFRSKFWK